MNRTAAIILLLLLFSLQGVVLYIISSMNPATLAGQRVDGITLAVDMLLFAGFISVYQKNFSKTVYSNNDEHNYEDE